MKCRCLSLLLLLGAAVFAPSLAVAAGPLPELLGGFRNWAAYATGTGDAKVCYALSRPISSEPRKARRDPIYFLINDWPGRKAKAEPEIVPGYQYKDGSDVTVDVGSAKFTFFTKNDGGAGGAWVEAQADEQRLVDAMKTAPEAIVTGTSKRGTVTRDTYSLAGLGDALDKAHAACAM
ncbi:MAG TPA: invasion associated locus B family protein [Rhizomicrobium sp.]|nr:invasion associated locus B family protein [Rhizomicrobium sp.]